jgi:microcystin-dependent protein
MSSPFLGEIKMFAGNFAPKNWAFCNGQILNISQATALFSLLGTNYGGDGRTTFGLPNLQSRVPMHWGTGPGLSSRDIGETGGVPIVTLTIPEMASHSHAPLASTGAGALVPPSNAYWAASSVRDKQFATAAPDAAMLTGILDPSGGNQPHDNQFPFLVVTYIIATAGIFPQRP